MCSRRLHIPQQKTNVSRRRRQGIKHLKDYQAERNREMSATLRAFVVTKTAEQFTAQVQALTRDDLPPGEVLIHVAYSSVNYKDALACTPDGKVVRSYPFVPGIDLAGVVVESSDERFHAGDEVIATSYDLGVSHYGGFSEYAPVRAHWVVPLPKRFPTKKTMALGTAP